MNRSIATVKADLARSEFGVSGKGIVWAVVGSGVDSKHTHFQPFGNLRLPKGLHHLDFSSLPKKRRELLWEGGVVTGKNVSAPVDVGNNTQVAGIIAGRGEDFGDMCGVAPETTILSIKVFGGDEFNLLAALRAIQQLNESSGTLRIHGAILALTVPWDRANFACGHSPVCVEVDRLVNSGTVVVVPAGDRGFTQDSENAIQGSISDPGNAELAITVGATHRTIPEIYGASYFSSRGPTSDGRRKPDLLAPGERIASPAKDGEYLQGDGTVYGAAHVAGAAALLLSAMPGLIGKPLEVKALFKRTAVNLGRDENYQGAGLLDVAAAIREAVGSSGSAGSVQRAAAVKVFVSYSHKDKALWEEFSAHLSALERGGKITVWSDKLIEAGTKWEAEIYQHLDNADVVLLLVSAFFMQSDFCYSKEFGRAVARGAKIIPVRIRPVTLTGTPLEAIQALPPDAKPITSFPDPHEGWATVTQKLYEIATNLRSRL